MNREIKFRGIHNHVLPQNEHLNGIWIYGYLEDENYINSPELEGEFLVDKDTVGQYTGRKDKKENEIYEDDIVLSDDGKIGQVQWFEEHAAFMIWCVTDNKVYFLYDNDFSKIEVIGNVYENADLLEGENNNE